jgi:hypothetical protein
MWASGAPHAHAEIGKGLVADASALSSTTITSAVARSMLHQRRITSVVERQRRFEHVATQRCVCCFVMDACYVTSHHKRP